MSVMEEGRRIVGVLAEGIGIGGVLEKGRSGESCRKASGLSCPQGRKRDRGS